MALYSAKHQELTKYNEKELMNLLGDRHYHLPEMSETDEENTNTRKINVYDLSWRSEEVLVFRLFVVYICTYTYIFSYIF
jgi:hypothetical protein